MFVRTSTSRFEYCPDFTVLYNTTNKFKDQEAALKAAAVNLQPDSLETKKYMLFLKKSIKAIYNLMRFWLRWG